MNDTWLSVPAVARHFVSSPAVPRHAATVEGRRLLRAAAPRQQATTAGLLLYTRTNFWTARLPRSRPIQDSAVSAT